MQSDHALIARIIAALLASGDIIGILRWFKYCDIISIKNLCTLINKTFKCNIKIFKSP